MDYRSLFFGLKSAEKGQVISVLTAKSEIRSSKSETNYKFKCFNYQNNTILHTTLFTCLAHFSFGDLILFRDSIFGLRIFEASIRYYQYEESNSR